MKRLFIFFVVFTGTLTISSCDIDDDGDSFHYTALEITDVELPDSFEMGQIYNINVTMLRPDSCTLMEGFDVRRGDSLTIRNVTAVGIVLDRDDCEVVNQEVTDSFQFEVLYDQTYVFRFLAGEDNNGEKQFIEVEVPVN